MNMNFFQSLLMGFVSGMTGILPVSPEAHRTLLRTFFGIGAEDAVFRFLVHAAFLASLAHFYRSETAALRRTRSLMKIPPRRRKRPVDAADANTLRLLRGALLVALIIRLIPLWFRFPEDRLELLAPALLLNGLVLLIPTLTRSANMDSRNMPRINGLIMGFGAGAGIIPGFSPVAGAVCLGRWRGVDRTYALSFGYILLIPLTAVELVYDLFGIFTGKAASFSGSGLICAVAGAIAAFFGCRLALSLMKKLSRYSGFGGFAYYSFGMALLCFVLFLMI